MPQLRDDLDQAIRYVDGASVIMERTAEMQTRGLRKVLAQASLRLRVDAPRLAYMHAETLILKRAATRAIKLGVPDAAMELYKAVSVLRSSI